MVEKEKVVFKNRYGEDITFLVRKSKPKSKLAPVVSVEELEKCCPKNSRWFAEDNGEASIILRKLEAWAKKGEKVKANG